MVIKPVDRTLVVDDADGIREVCEMVATMLLTSLEVLSEHNLFTTDSEIKNIPIVCLIFLEFFDNTAGDLSLACQCEILRLCDEVGIDLAKHVRKQLHIPETKFNEWRDQYKSKKEDFPDANDGNGYKFWAEKDDWKPADEMKLNPRWNQMERQWFRWDWKLEVQLPTRKDAQSFANHLYSTKNSRRIIQEETTMLLDLRTGNYRARIHLMKSWTRVILIFRVILNDFKGPSQVIARK